MPPPLKPLAGGHYSLTSLTAKEGVIVLKTTVDVETEVDGEGQKIIIKMRATSNSSITFDPATGLIRTQENKISGNGTFSMQGMSIPMTIKGTNTEKFILK